MTDEIPADLINLKRDLYAADAELAALSAKMPSATAVVAGEAEENPDDRARWTALHKRAAELAMQIHRHPALAALAPTERLKLDAAASRAARGAE